jgi:hypothetical protein
MNKVILKRFEQPDEIVEFEKGKFETVRIGELVIGRATYGLEVVRACWSDYWRHALPFGTCWSGALGYGYRRI